MSATPASQTLSRGIRILEILSDARSPLTIDELAARLGVHRSIAYRLLRTLEDHGLVIRDSAGLAALGPRMAALAAGVAHDLQAEALPELTAVANDLGMTCFLAVLDGEECITLTSVEPRHAIASVAQRPGARHPATVGAPGKAILAQLPDADWPADASAILRADVATVRARGFATSHDEVIPTVRSVAVPLDARGQPPTALAVVHVATRLSDEEIADRLERSARTIRDSLGG
ncbi:MULTISPECIES: IclR family transcriptional regulator [Bacteria]|uniref:IclR family transcriptional regulator n=1 Tax=Bacteria TaxID=2 RepID=UPI003C7EBA20